MNEEMRAHEYFHSPVPLPEAQRHGYELLGIIAELRKRMGDLESEAATLRKRVTGENIPIFVHEGNTCPNKDRAESLQRRVDELELAINLHVNGNCGFKTRAEKAEKERDEARNKTLAAMVDFSNRLIVIEAGMNRWSNKSALEQMERLKTSIRAQFGVPELPQWPSQEFQDEYALTVSGLNANLATAEKRLAAVTAPIQELTPEEDVRVQRLIRDDGLCKTSLEPITAKLYMSVRFLRGKLDEAALAFEQIYDESQGKQIKYYAKEAIARIRGGRQ